MRAEPEMTFEKKTPTISAKIKKSSWNSRDNKQKTDETKAAHSPAGEVAVGTEVTPPKNKGIIKHNTRTFFPVSLVT
jgi:hypothetical protein